MEDSETVCQPQIQDLVTAYCSDQPVGYVSPMVAQATGKLSIVAKQIGVPVEELDEYLTRENAKLPPVGEL